MILSIAKEDIVLKDVKLDFKNDTVNIQSRGANVDCSFLIRNNNLTLYIDKFWYNGIDFFGLFKKIAKIYLINKLNGYDFIKASSNGSGVEIQIKNIKINTIKLEESLVKIDLECI